MNACQACGQNELPTFLDVNDTNTYATAPWLCEDSFGCSHRCDKQRKATRTVTLARWARNGTAK